MADMPHKKRRIKWASALLVIIGLGILAFLAWPAHKTTRDEAEEAYLAAKLFCERCDTTATNFTCDPQLPEYNQKGRWSTNTHPPHWSVMGYVDCEHPHGASKSNLRQLWAAELLHKGRTWHMTHLDIAGEVFCKGE